MIRIAAAALAAAMSMSAASAADQQNVLAKDQVVLDLRNLDLASVKGQQQLAIRMDQAARAVCGDRLATVHLDLETQSRTCRASVMADIRTRIEARVARADVAPATPVLLASR